MSPHGDGVAGVPVKAVSLAPGVTIRGPPVEASEEVLTSDAVRFVAGLHRRFEGRRQDLLERRRLRLRALASGGRLEFPEETRTVRDSDWTVAPPPADLRDRRVEITGPTDAKMMINALNSGARVFMADFEDANVPTWYNLLEGQANVRDAVERRIRFTSPEGKEYRLVDEVATLMVRPRGWHLPEKHLAVEGKPVSGSLFDFGLFAFHCAKRLLGRGSGPYLYLPKMESHVEARLWNDVCAHAEEVLGLPHASFRATCLVETAPAAHEMDEILHELKDRSVGLNAGRWDYLFSVIKTFRHRPDLVLPDRGELTMTVPFMRAYTELLVATCHRRGAHAMGGMAAFIPNRRDPEVTEKALAKVREDKVRESGDGFDGTWVAHPDLVPVAKEVFDRALGKRANQVERQRPEVRVTPADLQRFDVPGGAVTEAGVRSNVDVGLQYVSAWLGGTGAVAIANLMEDAATAEIARSQLWQWVARGARLADGRRVTADLVRRIVAGEMAAIAKRAGDGAATRRLADARILLEQVALADPFVEFLTLPAYDRILEIEGSE